MRMLAPCDSRHGFNLKYAYLCGSFSTLNAVVSCLCHSCVHGDCLIINRQVVFMKKIELDIVALSHSVAQSHNYAIVLGEMDGVRRLPIVIGSNEAQSIAIALEHLAPNRPLTHDLFRNLLVTFEIDLKEIIINNLLDGVFYAKLVCVKDGSLTEIDSRTSDALALAVRFGCPIYTYDFVLDAAGIVMEDEQQKQPPAAASTGRKRKEKNTPLAGFSTEDLNRMLNEVLEKEDYEKAAAIRDELNKRK